jgi:hypothetical protein
MEMILFFVPRGIFFGCRASLMATTASSITATRIDRGCSFLHCAPLFERYLSRRPSERKE